MPQVPSVMRAALFSFGLLTALVTGGPPVFAQEPARMYRLGVLSPSEGTFQRIRKTMLPELAKLGFAEGGNLAIETRFGPTDQLPALARDLVTVHPQVVLAVGSFAIRAIRATGPTPVVGSFIGDDPIAAGFAENLAHPGGSVTGIVMLAPELDAKRLDVLHSAVPTAHRIAALAVSPERSEASIAAMQEVATHLGLEVLPFYAATTADYAKAFEAMHTAKVDCAGDRFGAGILRRLKGSGSARHRSEIANSLRMAVDGK
jgi:putative ABC transport system substrate-binding protein